MSFNELIKQQLAVHGGPKTVNLTDEQSKDLFHWPIVTEEDEQAVISVMRAGSMSGTDITKQFEAEYAQYIGTKYALGYCNGTAALLGAMWACGVGAGDEIICQSMTYWASAAPAFSLGATVNFADIEKDTLCIDPDDIEHRIGPKTKAIVVVHYAGHPADMDRIMAIANKHGVKVIEDVSHAHGTLYKGRMTGSIGHVGAMSMMAGKSFAVGEAGMLTTDDREIYERAIAFGHYERTGGESMYTEIENAISDIDLAKYKGLPLGGYKHRMNQTCAAMGRVQLKHYPARIAEIQKSMNYFWDLLEGTPGIRAHRPAKESGGTMGGWYAARGLYRSEELGDLPLADFCAAVQAEGVHTGPGANGNLHLHAAFHDADIFNEGKPTVISKGQRDVRQGEGTLPVSESIKQIAFTIPWFKKDRPELVEQYAAAFKKVAVNAEKLQSVAAK